MGITRIGLSIELDRAAVLRLLGYPRASGPAGWVEERLAKIWDRALGALDPKGAWVVISSEEARATGMPDPADRVGIGLATIGPRIEAEVIRSGQGVGTLDALLLDAVGSAAAEAAADALNSEICSEARRLGLYAATRVSPGYGRWEIHSQPRLLALLRAEEIGVSLTEGMMMVPRKSVSFAANLLAQPPADRAGDSRCSRCGMRNCAYKEEG
jgi:hypothetical protein